MYSYRPDFTILPGKRSNIPTLEDRLDNIARVRKEAEAALCTSKEQMRAAYKRNKKTAYEFKPGDLVGLSAKDIHIYQPSTLR